MPINGSETPSERQDNEEVVIDLGLMSKMIRRRFANLLLWMIVSGAVCAAILLFLVPQTYTCSVSISLQQATQMMSLNALIGGPPSPGSRYVGVLHSTRLAREVEQSARLQSLYHLKTKREAVEKVVASQQVDGTSTDGLLYIKVSLPGPPRLSPFGAERRTRVKRTAVIAANAYAAALKRYIRYSDTDKDAVLLREADHKLHDARMDYDKSLDRLIEFVRAAPTTSLSPDTGASQVAPASSNTTPSTTGTSATDATSRSGAVSGAVAQLQNLLVRKGQLEIAIKSAETTRTSVGNLIDRPMDELATMPTEDPLLADARLQVSDATLALKNLESQYGDSNSRVVVARERLKIVTAHLAAQVDSLRSGMTNEKVQLDRLRSEYEEVSRQLKTAERDFAVSRNLTAEYERLHAEVLIRLDVLKTIFSRYAELSLQTVGAQNRMLVVDEAEEPKSGSPSLLIIVIVSVLVGVLVAAWSVVREFARATASGTNAK